jgi:hypothetical protein
MLHFMERYNTPTPRLLGSLLVILTCCAIAAFASRSQQNQPVATLGLSGQTPCCKEPAWRTVAFTSNATIAVSRCQGECSLSLIRWDGKALRLYAQTVTKTGALSIYPADGGLIFSKKIQGPMVWYSADLSASRELPSSISMFSETGGTAAETTVDEWKVYRFTGALEFLLAGKGRLQSISDDILVVQEANVVNVITLQGAQIGSFSIPSENARSTFVRIIGGNRLWMDDSKHERIVDFSGKTLSQLQPPKGCCFRDDTWSADGRRLLFDYRDRAVSLRHNPGELVRMLTTLGMSGQEWPNHETVQAVDTLTGNSCLDWQRAFEKPNDVAFGRTAAISPSGDFVAIVTKHGLSIYRLRTACGNLPPKS